MRGRPVSQERPLLIVHLREGQRPTKAALLKFLSEKLAKWQLPDDVVFVDALPHTAPGKLLRRNCAKDSTDI